MLGHYTGYNCANGGDGAPFFPTIIALYLQCVYGLSENSVELVEFLKNLPYIHYGEIPNEDAQKLYLKIKNKQQENSSTDGDEEEKLNESENVNKSVSEENKKFWDEVNDVIKSNNEWNIECLNESVTADEFSQKVIKSYFMKQLPCIDMFGKGLADYGFIKVLRENPDFLVHLTPCYK